MKRDYVTTRQLASLQERLSPRDLAILSTLRRVRLATGQHLERLHFMGVSRRRATQVLAKLVDFQLLVRLPRVVGGVRAGSAGYVYTLDVAGQRLTAEDQQSRAQRPWNVGTPFVAHTLAVTELYVQLVEAERVGTLRLVRFTGEPGCWRRFAGLGGVRMVLKPDAHLVVETDGFVDRWFIEMDRGTESVPTLARKCDVYRRYWQSGREQAYRGVFPRVLWLVPDEARRAALVNVFGRQPAEAWPLFADATSGEAVIRIARGAHL